jgi:hypothetical protein
LSQDPPSEAPEGASKSPSDAPDHLTAAEKKRQAARRRFLLGGAAAVPLVFTVRQAKAVTWTQCQEANLLPDPQGIGTGLVPGLREQRGSFADDFPPCQDFEDALREYYESSESTTETSP